MNRLVLSILCLCMCAMAWTPLQVVPLNKKVIMGELVSIDGMSSPNAKTLVNLSRTEKELVFDITCFEEEKDKIVARVAQRDGNVWQDDCVEIFIQPKGWKDYAHFSVNTLGTLFDELNREVSWNAVWTVKSEKNAFGWTATVTIPFAVFGTGPQDGDEWKMNVCRSRQVHPELSVWSPTASGFHNPEAFGTIRFSEEPYLTGFSFNAMRSRQRQVEFHLFWPVKDVATTIAGKPLAEDGIYTYGLTDVLRLEIESTYRGKVILRKLFVKEINAVAPLFLKAALCLDGLEGAEARKLSRKLTDMEELADSLAPEKQLALSDTLELLLRQANNARVRELFQKDRRQDGEIVYGVTHSLVKLLKEQPFQGTVGGEIKLDAGRREMDAAQISLFAGASPLLLVEAKVDGDFKNGDKLLPASCLRLRRVGYVMTNKPVYKVDYTGLWPDPLMKLSSFDVSPYSFETLWADVRVPESTPAGVYQGGITVTAMNSQPTRIPVRIRVRNFTIPSKSSITSAFGLGPHWRVPQDRQAYIQNMLEHRITPYDSVPMPKMVKPQTFDLTKVTEVVVTVTVNAPAACQIYVNTVKDGLCPLCEQPMPFKAGTCSLKADIQKFREQGITEVRCVVSNVGQARLKLAFMKNDGTEEVVIPESEQFAVMEKGWLKHWPTWTYGAWENPANTAVFDWTEFDAAFEKALAMGITSHRAGLRFPLGAWSAEFQRHLGEKGWLPYFYTYLFDEPERRDYSRVNELLLQVKEPRPGVLKNMMTARSFPPELPFVDIWCPELYSYNAELSQAEQRKGREVWWYVAFSTRHPYPNIWIDYPAIDCRVWPWMSWKHDIDGMLYWSITHWPKNPWLTGEMFPHANGDGSMLYPGSDGKPVDSIRWECLRDGMEDYEVFCLLEAAARELAGREPELVERIKTLCKIPQEVVFDYKHYNEDPQYLLKARQGMSDCLEQAVAALGHEPAIQGHPRRRPGVTPSEVAVARKAMQASNKDAIMDTSWDSLDVSKQPAATPRDGLMLHYKFDSGLPYIFDYSGHGFVGFPTSCTRGTVQGKPALRIDNKGYLTLPAGQALFGAKAVEGTVEFDVRPDFNPEDMVKASEDHYACLFYVMETDGNGLPDGFDEVAIFIKNGSLCARSGGKDDFMGGCPNPLRKGQWHHIVLSWKPGWRRLFVDGKAVIANDAPYTPSRMDAFQGTLGAHCPHKSFSFDGAFADLKIWNRAMEPTVK